MLFDHQLLVATLWRFSVIQVIGIVAVWVIAWQVDLFQLKIGEDQYRIGKYQIETYL